MLTAKGMLLRTKPGIQDIIKALNEHGLVLQTSQLVSLLNSLRPDVDKYPYSYAYGETLIALGRADGVKAEPLIREALETRVAIQRSDFIVVSPDGGRAKVAEDYAENLNVDVVHMPKSRDVHDSSKISRPDFIDEVEGRTCLLIDDMIDTAGTLVSAGWS